MTNPAVKVKRFCERRWFHSPLKDTVLTKHCKWTFYNHFCVSYVHSAKSYLNSEFPECPEFSGKHSDLQICRRKVHKQQRYRKLIRSVPAAFF